MLQQKGGLVGERLFDQRRMVDLEVVGIVVTRFASRRPRGRQLNVSGVDEVLAIADAHQQRCGDLGRVPKC